MFLGREHHDEVSERLRFRGASAGIYIFAQGQKVRDKGGTEDAFTDRE